MKLHLLTALWLGVGANVLPASAANFPAWRGDGSGVLARQTLPPKWSLPGEVRWKAPLAEPGNGSPVVWGNRVFIAQAHDSQRQLLAFDRATGRSLWQAVTKHEGKEETHSTNPYASSTPVTDGERVIVWYGSAGLACYDMQGKELWRRDLGKQEHQWGYGQSPVLYRDLCLLNFGPGPNTFLIAVDKRTGKTVWKKDFPPSEPKERTDGFAGKTGPIGSWSTPLLIQRPERDEVVVSFPDALRSFDPATGKELWFCRGLTPLIYTSPIYGEGVVVAMAGFGGSSMAVKLGGSGDVTETHRLWHFPRSKQRIGSGVVANGHIYILNTPGIAECIELKTGKEIWSERLAGSGPKSESWSSLLLVGNTCYALNQAGDILSFKAAPAFEKLGVTPLNEPCNSSLAVADGQVFVRTHKHLWSLGAAEQAATRPPQTARR